MIVRYRQTSGHNCGIYSIANAINEGNIITPERCEEGEKGHHIFALNRYLREDKKDFHLETIYKNIFSGTLPDDVELYPVNDDFICPMIIGVTVSGINHMVALRVYKDKTLEVIDSLKENVINTTFKDLNKIYDSVFSLYAFRPNDASDEGYIMLSYN